MNPKALHWRCRRGLLELDLAFAQFLKADYEMLDPALQGLFQELLAENDADLWAWLQGESAPARYAPILQYLTLEFSCPSEHKDSYD